MILFVQGDQVGIAPRMFKALVGRGHPEFSTNRQQDAQEFLLHFINMVEVMMLTFSCCLCFSLLVHLLNSAFLYVGQRNCRSGMNPSEASFQRKAHLTELRHCGVIQHRS